MTLLGQVVPGEEERVLKQMGAWIERRVEEMKDGEWEQAQVASQTAFALRSEMIHPWLTQRALDWTLGMDPYRVEERYSLSDLHRCLERVFHPHAPSVVSRSGISTRTVPLCSDS